MKIVYLIIIFNFIIGCNSKKNENEIRIKYYPGDTLLEQITSFKGVQLHGYYMSFYKNGKLHILQDFDNGILKQSTVFFENGKINKIEYYKGGNIEILRNGNVLVNESKLNGDVLEFYESGSLAYKNSYDNGKKNGFTYGFYDNGLKHNQVYYKNNIRINQAYEYDNSTGNLAMYWEFDSLGNQTYHASFDKTGNKVLKAEGKMK